VIEVWRARSGIVAGGCARGRVRFWRRGSARQCVAAAGSEDRVGHDVGPVPGDVVAGAVDDDMASVRGGRGERCLQARPVRAEPAGQREAAGSAQHDDGHVGKGPCGGAQLPQGRIGCGDVTVQLIGVDGAHDPPPLLQGQGQPAFHLLCPGSTRTRPAARSGRRKASSSTRTPPQLCPASTQGPAAGPVITDARSSIWRSRTASPGAGALLPSPARS
jgi:hypothetical protein